MLKKVIPMSKKYFVKFKPFNQYLISSLINKTIKFSTVYDFNDFNELAYMHPYHNDTTEDCFGSGEASEKEKLDKEILKKLDSLDFRCKLLKNIEQQSFREEYLKKVKNYLNQYNRSFLNGEDVYRMIAEGVIMHSVGIFCASHIDIFKDDAAQLMFAHYADNLKGVALIYEVDACDEVKKITYETNLVSDAKYVAIALSWLEGNFDDPSSFLYKSPLWCYENEHRIFEKPGVQPLPKGLKLRAILHTSRFDKSNLETLSGINKKFYNSKLSIEEIYAAQTQISDYKQSNAVKVFKISDTNKTVSEWLQVKFCLT